MPAVFMSVNERDGMRVFSPIGPGEVHPEYIEGSGWVPKPGV